MLLCKNIIPPSLPPSLPVFLFFKGKGQQGLARAGKGRKKQHDHFQVAHNSILQE